MTRLIGRCVIIVAIVLAVLYFRYGGVTHERIYDAVVHETADVKEHVDNRYFMLDQKLTRIEAKLDKLLEIATRPLPDDIRIGK